MSGCMSFVNKLYKNLILDITIYQMVVKYFTTTKWLPCHKNNKIHTI